MIKQGWFLSLVGCILLSIGIYYIAPAISTEDSTLIRLSGIAGLVVIWAVFQLIHLWRVHREDAAMLNSLRNMGSAATINSEVDEELDILQERIVDAVSELKNNRGKEGGQLHYLYKVPWYILIGPPASGKTTLLKNSSLRSVLSKKFGRESIGGIGGTRHCDWWFAEQAVLLDTAGRYVSQDSNKAKDSQAWLGFLSLLQKSRERRPINGIMIAISVNELLLSGSLQQRAKEVRQRLQELYDQFSLELPVYLIFTKTDLLDGFAEFFADQDKKSRQQVWGITFTEQNKIVDTPLPQFLEELSRLEDTLKDQLPYKLQQESILERRKKIYAFPEQFAALKDSAHQFAHEVFADSEYQQNILFRGAYFTSAEQVGSPINKLLANLSSTFGFEPAPIVTQRNRGKSYFIDDLLQKVVFPEAELAGVNPDYEKKRRWLQWGTIASIGFLALLSIVLWVVSYQNNKTNTQSVKAEIEVLQQLTVKSKDDNSISSSLEILNQVARLDEKIEDTGVMATFGLSQRERLQLEIKSKYTQILHIRLLPYILDTLERGLQKNIANTKNKVKLADYLKGYLILDPKYSEYYPSNTAPLKELLYEDWWAEYKNELKPTQLKQLTAHLDKLLESKPALTAVGFKQNKKLIEDARAILREKNGDQTVDTADWFLEK